MTAKEKIEAQQEKVAKNSPAWCVGEQLKDMIANEPHIEDIISRDLDIEQMSISEAEKKIKAFADKNRHGSVGFCPPQESDRILREFYGLPKQEEKHDGGFLAQKKKCVDSDEVCENSKDEICENCKKFRSDRTEFDEENSNGGYCYRGNEEVRRKGDDTCKRFERTEDYANRKCGECACFEDCDGTDGGKSDPACRSFTERKKTESEKTVIRVTTEKEADIEGMPKTVSAEKCAALPKMPEVVREMIAEKYAELKRSMNVIEKQIDELTEDRNACLSDLEELDAFMERWNDK